MKKNLIIMPAGDDSLHINWIDERRNYDLILLYYGKSELKLEEYSKSATAYKVVGEKWHLIHNFLSNNTDLISQYEYIWFPDDDLEISFYDVNKLFDINKQYSLWLSQPSMSGFVSHPIFYKDESTILRYSDFVEIICPVMSSETVNKLLQTFILNESAWGIDYLWPKLLGYPTDKIAIIDTVSVIHTKPAGSNYNGRFKDPTSDMFEILSKYNIEKKENIYSKIKL